MSGETSITVTGNLTADPELGFTTAGTAFANFTIASTPRVFDQKSGGWVDGEVLYLRASLCGGVAGNAAGSLARGMRVIATGVMKPRNYTTKAGENRAVIELDVDEIGASLRYATAEVHRSPRAGIDAAEGDLYHEETRPADLLSLSSRAYADDDLWFGLTANPEGRITPSGADRHAG